MSLPALIGIAGKAGSGKVEFPAFHGHYSKEDTT
jgi:hypothetical protein